MEFEYIGDDQIEFVENHSTKILTHDIYKIFIDEKSNNNDIKLIPSSYYTMLTKHEDVNADEFNNDEWVDKIKPFIPDKTDACLFGFQKRAIQNMVKRKRCLNASSMGIGKSIQSLCALASLRVERKGDLILCPGYLKDNWKNEISKWFPYLLDKTVIIDKAGKNDIENARDTLIKHRGIVIISYDMAAKIFSEFKKGALNVAYFNTIICDESHFLKERSTIRYKNLNRPIKAATNLFLLTGTPAPNRPKELFTQFSLIQPKMFTDYRTFAYRFCGGFTNHFGQFEDRGSSRLRELSILMKKMVIRLRREDVLDELPSVMRHQFILTPKQKSTKFNALMKRFKEKLKEAETDKNASFILQSLTSEMFRETSKIKKEPVLEYINDYIQQNTEKTIFFCKHLELQRAISASLKEDHIVISGEVPSSRRTELIRHFLEDPECKYAVLTIDSCSTGLNFIPVSKMIFCELTWSPSDLQQCEARISRIGGAKHLEYAYLICMNTLDEMVFRKLQKKVEMTTQIVDDGVDYGDMDFNKRKSETEGCDENKKTRIS